MQVLLRKSDDQGKQDVQCSVCNQGFRIYWERTSDSERAAMRVIVLSELKAQHNNDLTTAAHPSALFNVPNWQGPAQFSGAAMLGGLSTIRRAACSTAQRLRSQTSHLPMTAAKRRFLTRRFSTFRRAVLLRSSGHRVPANPP